MGQSFPLGKIAVYIHIPFCLSKCGYCSFYSEPYRRDELQTYVSAIEKEVGLFGTHFGIHEVRASTVYFGGGTPSLLASGQINRMCGLFLLDSDSEVTIEVNPLQITSAFLQDLRNTPVNRLSIGLQSSRDDDLVWLERKHRFSGFSDRLKLCRDNGFDNISLDLMYGLPDSNVDSLKAVLEDYIALEPQHISCYLLSLDVDCSMLRKQGSAILDTLPDGDECSRQYHSLRQTLVSAGYTHYEISNFARPGRESRHNLCYWHSDPYLALGASASGWLPPIRYSDPADLDSYYQMVDRGNIMLDAEECDALQAERDYVMMGLRLMDGLDTAEFELRFGKPFLAGREKALKKMQKLGMITIDTRSVKLTEPALFVSNTVIGELL